MSAWHASKCRIITEAEHLLEGPIAGPLTLEESYRSERATARCKVCGCVRLKRELVETRIFGVRCIDRAGCLRHGDVERDDGRHQSTRAERPRWQRSDGSAPKRAPTPGVFTPKQCEKCQRRYDEFNWGVLSLLDAGDTECGDIIVHTATKRCLCGESLTVTSERLRDTGLYLGGPR